MVVLLRDVHLRLCWNSNRSSGDDPENGKEKFHPYVAIGPARCCPVTCQSNTDVALREVALKTSEYLRLSDFIRNDHIHCIRHELDFRLVTDHLYSYAVKKERNIPA